MKSKIICLLTAVCMLFICFGLYNMDLDKKTVRIHQHLEPDWQPAKKAAGGVTEEFATHLPIVNVDTGGQRIPGAPDDSSSTGFGLSKSGEETILAGFSLIDGKKGENRPDDELDVTSSARIRCRGNSSRFFHKKSYAISLVDENGEENKKELAGMEAHNEWVLNGPFLDRTLMRNYLCYNVAGQIMDYAPNIRYCQLFIDGDYQGVYLLVESIARGKGRIDIPVPERNSRVTSYIVRWDRAGKGDHELDNYTCYTYRGDVSALDVRYPGRTRITPERFAYIEEDISRIEKVLYSYDLLEKRGGGTDYVDYNSFAEYFIINEFFRNVDAGRFSTFYYKNARGKVKTCVWDFNNACDNYIDYVWDEAGFTVPDAPWFGRLLKDERFVALVVEKYRLLRKDVLSEQYLLSYIDEVSAWLGDSVEQNYEKWGYVFDMERYHGMNYLTPVERNDKSYEEALDRLKAFIVSRGSWLDAHIDTLYQYCHESKNVNELTR